MVTPPLIAGLTHSVALTRVPLPGDRSRTFSTRMNWQNQPVSEYGRTLVVQGPRVGGGQGSVIGWVGPADCGGRQSGPWRATLEDVSSGNAQDVAAWFALALASLSGLPARPHTVPLVLLDRFDGGRDGWARHEQRIAMLRSAGLVAGASVPGDDVVARVRPDLTFDQIWTAMQSGRPVPPAAVIRWPRRRIAQWWLRFAASVPGGLSTGALIDRKRRMRLTLALELAVREGAVDRHVIAGLCDRIAELPDPSAAIDALWGWMAVQPTSPEDVELQWRIFLWRVAHAVGTTLPDLRRPLPWSEIFAHHVPFLLTAGHRSLQPDAPKLLEWLFCRLPADVLRLMGPEDTATILAHATPAMKERLVAFFGAAHGMQTVPTCGASRVTRRRQAP